MEQTIIDYFEELKNNPEITDIIIMATDKKGVVVHLISEGSAITQLGMCNVINVSILNSCKLLDEKKEH